MRRASVATICLLAVFAASCLTIDVADRSASALSAGTVTVGIYKDASALRSTRVFDGEVRSRLIRTGSGPGEKVFESDQARWSVADLKPGKYRLEVLSWAERDGSDRHDEIESGEFELKIDSGIELEVVLRDRRGAIWASVSGVAAVGIGIVTSRGF